jgi:putative PIN family toxin of toxin-antitoxin system
VRAVLDPNVLVSSLLSPAGAPARIVSRWLAGDFELVVSERLLAEVERALAYPKLRTRVESAEASAFVTLLRHSALLAPDPSAAPARSSDPGDCYLLALAEHERALLVSGDRHLLDLAHAFPIRTARGFLETLG